MKKNKDLFYLAFLLLLSTRPQIEEELAMINSLVQTAQNSIQIFKSGLKILQAGIKLPEA
ncbi:hypothetical protein HY02_08665 [Peptococcaceae bacterium SCADC1_2_3]|nr:hypothetical protein DK28_0204000 [Peptococcaceae bacterium SCADC1_2_3]KFI35794.1 hypothetical protein HY00_01205 [Peptococcaceae bacterium SCADC1_2_3]KFI37270.1 hypothetical protein HY02_08665 [Peptococcaceae bacterium SCADC1_2_3]HBQ29407.1 hypothetical protein [Desulfotomaculum sp.]HCJ79305.1 hypothetical protein [Desulfotomaculum sp.]